MVPKNDNRREPRPNGSSHSSRVLLAESDADRARVLTWILRGEGYDVSPCGSGKELLAHLNAMLKPDHEPRFEVIVSDIRMPGRRAVAVLETACSRETFPPMILCAPFGQEDVVSQARRLELTPFEERPFEVEELVSAVRAVAPITVRFTR